VLVITQYSLPEHKYNMNAYQRNYYGSAYATIHLLIRNKHMVSQELCERVTLHRAPVHNRVMFFFYAVSLGLWLRLKGVNVVLTEPSKYAWVGFVLKYIGGYFWGMDAWDPVWKEHTTIKKHIKMIERLTFWAMGRADLFILSCLPEAVKQIRPSPERSVQFFNAINLSGIIATSPPDLCPDVGEFHLAMARAILGRKEGFKTVLSAAEEIQGSGANIRIHLVGHIEDDASELLAKSPANGFFEVHGFIKESRYEFFKSMHVGLVPYLPIEDMCHIFPIKVLEHLSQGNVVIASNLPGLAAMIQHEYNGLLFEPGNSHELAAAILRLYEDNALWKHLSRNAIESVKKYDPAAKNRTIFEEIAKRKRR
jgi:glycosyltransferase involved in cell wall biosynthesis